MTTTTPKTQILTRGSHCWRITRYAADHFVAVNNKGTTHIFDSEARCDKYWNFLESVGFRLRTEGWALATLVRPEA
jgi:hypothetical protein